jgi:hypothetical protein
MAMFGFTMLSWIRGYHTLAYIGGKAIQLSPHRDKSQLTMPPAGTQAGLAAALSASLTTPSAVLVEYVTFWS